MITIERPEKPLVQVKYTLEVYCDIMPSVDTLDAIRQAMHDALTPLRQRLERGDFNRNIVRSRRAE